MMSARHLLDRFLFQIRESGLIQEGGKILDIGTGGNTTIMELFCDRWNVTPSDVDVGDWNSHVPNMLVVDAEHITESKAMFTRWDAVFLIEVLEHVQNPQAVLRESFAVLAPKGVAVVSVPFFYRIHEDTPDDPDVTEPGLRDYWRITPTGLRLLFRRAGFDPFWVGRYCEEGQDAWLPKGVVGWGKKSGKTITNGVREIDEYDWNPEIPMDWQQHCTRLVGEYKRRQG